MFLTAHRWILPAQLSSVHQVKLHHTPGMYTYFTTAHVLLSPEQGVFASSRRVSHGPGSVTKFNETWNDAELWTDVQNGASVMIITHTVPEKRSVKRREKMLYAQCLQKVHSVAGTSVSISNVAIVKINYYSVFFFFFLFGCTFYL